VLALILQAVAALIALRRFTPRVVYRRVYRAVQVLAVILAALQPGLLLGAGLTAAACWERPWPFRYLVRECAMAPAQGGKGGGGSARMERGGTEGDRRERSKFASAVRAGVRQLGEQFLAHPLGRGRRACRPCLTGTPAGRSPTRLPFPRENGAARRLATRCAASN
jgi:hypothetical protein